MPGIRPTARTMPGLCGSLLPNDLGLFDMLGNVYEWCQDRQADYQPGGIVPVNDSINVSLVLDSAPRLLRGGAFNVSAGGPAVRTALARTVGRQHRLRFPPRQDLLTERFLTKMGPVAAVRGDESTPEMCRTPVVTF